MHANCILNIRSILLYTQCSLAFRLFVLYPLVVVSHSSNENYSLRIERCSDLLYRDARIFIYTE